MLTWGPATMTKWHIYSIVFHVELQRPHNKKVKMKKIIQNKHTDLNQTRRRRKKKKRFGEEGQIWYSFLSFFFLFSYRPFFFIWPEHPKFADTSGTVWYWPKFGAVRFKGVSVLVHWPVRKIPAILAETARNDHLGWQPFFSSRVNLNVLVSHFLSSFLRKQEHMTLSFSTYQSMQL